MTFPDIDNPVTEAGGWATAIGGLLLQIGNSLDLTDVNPYLTALTTAAGFIFLIYKILNMRLKNKHQKMENVMLKKQLEENERKTLDN